MNGAAAMIANATAVPFAPTVALSGVTSISIGHSIKQAAATT